MEFSKEQLTQIRKQLIEQINSSFPEDKKAETLKQIEEMDDNQLIEFLKQNNLIKDSSDSNQNGQCVFCSMVFGDIPTTRIGENEKAIAILEINPVTEGHSLIIPKEHISERDKIPPEVYELAKEVGEKIKSTLGPKEIKVLEGEVMGHQIINLLPAYKNENLDSPRKKENPESLGKLKQRIESSPEQINLPEKPEQKTSPEPKTEVIDEKNTWLPKRKP
jgi:histidine triad (HIT) family protein